MNEFTQDEMNLLTDFWAKKAHHYLILHKPWDSVLEGGFKEKSIKWFQGARLNVSEHCLDQHLKKNGNKTALIWVGDKPNQERKYSFSTLHQEVCQMANAMKNLGVKKGDCVGIYLPMIPEAAIAMLACARIGAIHTVIFAGFSAQALKTRLEAAECKLLITADGYQRGGKSYELKNKADEATSSLSILKIIIQHNRNPITFDSRTDHWWHELQTTVSNHCPLEIMEAEDPLFILYTSGSTGKPKGLVHTQAGYLLQLMYTQDIVFNYQNNGSLTKLASEREVRGDTEHRTGVYTPVYEDSSTVSLKQFSAEVAFRKRSNDVFWCTADIGWITGHNYVVYGPLASGLTTLMFEGIPDFPTPARYWEIIDQYQVNVFYTAPTAIRALKRSGNSWLQGSSRQSLRLLGSVGEPINPEVWQWYHEQVGLGKILVIDTWWQTETGAIMICPPLNLTNKPQLKPGAAMKPIPGIHPVILDDKYQEIKDDEVEGILAMKYPWPSIARTVFKNHSRYSQYFKEGFYITGDSAKRDKDGDFWILGRVDDVLNVAGHRLGTAEIEGALLLHPQIAESAVVGVPHPVKGQSIYAFVSLQEGQPQQQLCEELVTLVNREIGAIAKPHHICFVNDLPKTRSGKIMRRILKIFSTQSHANESDLGDLSTLSNPQSISDLIEGKTKTFSLEKDHAFKKENQ